jgi:hypothetical protein
MLTIDRIADVVPSTTEQTAADRAPVGAFATTVDARILVPAELRHIGGGGIVGNVDF